MKRIIQIGVMLVAFTFAISAYAQEQTKTYLTNFDIASNAGIAYEKLDLKDKITKSDIQSKAVGSSEIKNGTIQGKDIKNGTVESEDIKNGSIRSKDIKNETIEGKDIKDGTITGDKMADDIILGANIATGAVTTDEILDSTILGADLAPDIDISTTGDIDAGTITGSGTLGTSGSRWSTIYADTLNYSTALTDANIGNTTVTMGGSSTLDTVNITANTAITDAQWSITNTGAASFSSVTGTSIYSSDIDTATNVNMYIGQNNAAALYLGANDHSLTTLYLNTDLTQVSAGTFNLAAADTIIDSGTSTPATCTVGQLFVDTDAADGSRLMVCTATNTWSAN